MIFQNFALKNSFGKHYFFQVRDANFQQNASKPMRFTDNLSAETFLRSFDQDELFWQRLANSLDVPADKTQPPIKVVASHINRSRLKIVVLSDAYKANGPRAQKTIKATGSLHRFQITRSADALTVEKAKPKAFANIREAETFVQSLDLNEKQLAELTKELSVPETIGASPAFGASNATEKLTNALCKEILNGDLVILDHGPVKGMMAKSDWELQEVSPIEVQEVPLAPVSEEPSTDYIEIQLMDEDGEPVADTKYWIKDSEGNEHEGVTDGDGMARLDEIPKGNCDISFPELDGWS